MHRPDISHARVTAVSAQRGAFARRVLLAAAFVGALLFVLSDGVSAAALPVASSDVPAVEQQGRDNGNNGNGNGNGNLVDKGRRIPEFPSTAVAGLFAIGAVGGYVIYQRRRSDAPQR